MIRGWLDALVRRYGTASFRRAYFRRRATRLMARIDADRARAGDLRKGRPR